MGANPDSVAFRAALRSNSPGGDSHPGAIRQHAANALRERPRLSKQAGLHRRIAEPQGYHCFQPTCPDMDEPYIKRIIGLPGDVVRITNGQVYVNDLPLQETYIAAPPYYAGSWSVPPGHVFVLGDNRNNSSDSHFWGVVALDSILGKAAFVFWPFSHLKLLNPANASAAENVNP